MEIFADHRLIEDMLFDGVASPEDGLLKPALDRPGHGCRLEEVDAERLRVET